jgi:hypothetical protein
MTAMAGRKRDEKKEQQARSFFDTYWFEFTVVALLGLGIFLLLERLQIKAAVYHFAVRHLSGLWASIRSAGRTTLDWLHEVETSDLVGFALIITAFVLMFWKLRLRALKRHPYIANCPECNADMHRIRCKPIHRLLGLLLWIRITHYSCCKCKFRNVVWRKRHEH